MTETISTQPQNALDRPVRGVHAGPCRRGSGAAMVLFAAAGLLAMSGNSFAAEDEISFVQQVQPILAKHCYACHGPDQAEGGLRFVDQQSAFAAAESGEFAIVPGDVDASQLIARVTADDSERMPPEGDPLSPTQIQILRQWIDQGAPWDKHWAFQPVSQVEPPVVDNVAWNQHPIDRFVFASLQGAGLQPNASADRATLIRRAYYDLTGLPPTARQVQQFVNDPAPNAFERLVDQLLDSPHYGERWGRHWLDLVRYAETNSYERDGLKPNAWKYRDYVIRSFNDDKPYDQFLREQLAGDELDEVTTESLTATGYYRLGIWDDEPADPLQAQFDGYDDIIMTTGQAMLGLTLNCARCHDHKIDPISQQEYYSFLAFIADVTPWGTRADQKSNNQIEVSQEKNVVYRQLEQQRQAIAEEMRVLEQRGIEKMDAPDQRATEGTAVERRRVLKAKLQAQLSASEWSAYQTLRKQADEIRKKLRALPPRETVMGLAKTDAQPAQTFVLFRGNPHAPGDEVRPAFPAVFETEPPAADAFQSTHQSAGRRRALADWITDPENRLTSRVMANRLWQFHFGRGIVRSSNNFGQLGTPPTHPELLDWLANQLVTSGWKLKPLHRLIMTSRTYQMSSAAQPAALTSDPNNELFWRFNPRRLSAEEVRDSILNASGTLNRDLYGPSVYPALSQEVLRSQSKPGDGWTTSASADQNRRSIYIHVKRSLLYPLLSEFDFPDPDLTCEDRFTTLQPGQALALLNSEFIHQQAAKLSSSIDSANIDDAEIVRRTVRAVLARQASDEEIREGELLMASLREDHGLTPARAVELYCLSVLNWNEFLFLD
jgi:mono/diheme cytochrome c family protein